MVTDLGAAVTLGAFAAPALPWFGLKLLQSDPAGLTAERACLITRLTRQTMTWKLLRYALMLAIASLGKVKPA